MKQKFKKKFPPISIGADISVKSFQIIEEELTKYPKAKDFNSQELSVIERLIHTSTCFDEVLNNIYFSPNAIFEIQSLLQKKAKIIVDVNMIKVGISDFYLKKYENEVICYINEPFTFEMAKRDKTTRSYAAVKEAIKRHKNDPLIFICGNAPTFIYALINTLIEENVDLKNIAMLNFPVGFVNVIESKEYALEFSKAFAVALITLKGRFGGSTLGVAALHAIYKLIKDYDGDKKYNGK